MDEPEKQRLENLATRVASLELKVEKPASNGLHPPNGQALRVAVGNLLQAQTDLQALGALLDQILAAEVQTDPVARKAQIRSVVAPASAFAGKQQQQIGDCLLAVYGMQNEAELADDRADLTRIANYWEFIDPADLDGILKAAVSDDGAVAVDLDRVRALAGRYKQLRREIALYTIPRRILRVTRKGFGVGAPLDFHECFKTELEDPADRVTVLRQLAEMRVDAVGGMVNVEQGMIYRVGGLLRRWVSYVLLLAAAALGLGVVWALSGGIEGIGLDFDGPDNATLDFDELWGPYLLMMAGVLAHIVKKASELSLVERSRGGEGGPEVILDRLPLWVHVREYRFLLTVAAAVAVFVTIGTAGQLTGVTALLAGYTVDSVADLAFQRFVGTVSAQSKSVKELLTAGKS